VEVEVRRTPVAAADLRAAVGRAYVKVTGRQAPPGVLQALGAQASLETGAGQSMYNFNFGGVKGAGPGGQTANAMTHEVINGKDVTLRQHFRAYATLDEGAEDYVRLMTQRFSGALPYAATGDLNGFAHALKQAGYYTASETDYAAALRGASAPVATAQAPPLIRDGTPTSYPSTLDISRVFDALSHSALKIADPPSTG
jgi:flagellar protein FlgJ